MNLERKWAVVLENNSSTAALSRQFDSTCSALEIVNCLEDCQLNSTWMDQCNKFLVCHSFSECLEMLSATGKKSYSPLVLPQLGIFWYIYIKMVAIVTYLIEVYHHIALQVLTALDIFQSQSEVDPSGIRDVKIVCIILVPLLNCRKYLILIRADNMHVLEEEYKQVSLLDISLVSTLCSWKDNLLGAKQRFIKKSNQKPKAIYLQVHMHILHILSCANICRSRMNWGLLKWTFTVAIAWYNSSGRSIQYWFSSCPSSMWENSTIRNHCVLWIWKEEEGTIREQSLSILCDLVIFLMVQRARLYHLGPKYGRKRTNISLIMN